MTRERLTVKKLYDLLAEVSNQLEESKDEPGFDWGAYFLGGLFGGLMLAFLYIFLLIHCAR